LWKNKPLLQSVASDSLFRLNMFFNFFVHKISGQGGGWIQ
jgi:hypothetical protein